MGDTDESRQLVQDEEIAYCLLLFGNAIGPAALGCVRALRARFSSRPDSQSTQEGAVNWAGIDARLSKLERSLMLQFGAGMPRGGGISIDAITGYDTDTDIPTQPFDMNGPGNQTSDEDPTRLDVPPGLLGR